MGVAYLPPVRKAFEQLADSTVGLFGGSERREISIYAPVSLASLWLAPKLPAFSRAFPGIDVRLLSVIWDHPAPTENTDLEIRYGAGQWRGYASEFLFSQRIVAVCNGAVLEQAHRSGAMTVGITNEPKSTLANMAEHVFLVRAGREKSVAATKTYTGQLL